MSRPSPGVAYLLWLPGLCGLCGLHRFYLGRPLSGLAWLFTLGLLGAGQLLDLFLVPALCDRAADEAERREWRRRGR